MSTDRIRELNDELRASLDSAKGRVMLTAAVADLPPDDLLKVMRGVRTFSDFNEDNDPYGEHDNASFEVDGKEYWFKIDYYAKDSDTAGSDDPADPDQTTRILTIMTPGDL